MRAESLVCAFILMRRRQTNISNKIKLNGAAAVSIAAKRSILLIIFGGFRGHYDGYAMWW